MEALGDSFCRWYCWNQLSSGSTQNFFPFSSSTLGGERGCVSWEGAGSGHALGFPPQLRNAHSIVSHIPKKC